ATLTSGGVGLSCKTVSFSLNGVAVGSGQTSATGVARVLGVSLAGIGGGTHTGAVAASFAGDAGYGASSGSNTLTVNRAPQTISFGTLANKTFGDPGVRVSATATSGLAVGFAASGNCAISGTTVHITGGGSCTITASQGGDGNYEPAADVAQSFQIGKASQTITFGALASK